MEENNTDGKRKIPPSIPANYVSILQLQERWIKEKERKRKEEEEGEEEERRREQQAEEQQRIEEDLKKAEEDLDESRANPSDRKHWERNSKKNEFIDGGEARLAEKEETAAIGSERGEDAAPVKERGRRKRYESKKKRRNQEVAAVKEVVVDECGSIAPPEYVVTENHTPVKEAILVYRKKGEKATAIETQFEDLSIKRGDERGESKNLKAQRRSSNRNRHKQKHELPPRRVRMPTETATMVWVKKGQNERADDGNASGVKPLNA